MLCWMMELDQKILFCYLMVEYLTNYSFALCVSCTNAYPVLQSGACYSFFLIQSFTFGLQDSIAPLSLHYVNTLIAHETI